MRTYFCSWGGEVIVPIYKVGTTLSVTEEEVAQKGVNYGTEVKEPKRQEKRCPKGRF